MTDRTRFIEVVQSKSSKRVFINADDISYVDEETKGRPGADVVLRDSTTIEARESYATIVGWLNDLNDQDG